MLVTRWMVKLWHTLTFYQFNIYLPVNQTVMLDVFLLSLTQFATALQSQITSASQQSHQNQLASYQCWLNLILQRVNSIFGYLESGVLPDMANLGDINFCVFMQARNEKVKLAVFATGDCNTNSGIHVVCIPIRFPLVCFHHLPLPALFSLFGFVGRSLGIWKI